jgi:hypothetical protein
VKPLERFLREVDGAWRPMHPGKQPLHIIGCGALLLQTDYQRGTKDGDILEAASLDAVTKASLLALAGKSTELHARHRMYLEVVGLGVPFLAHRPIWHPQRTIDAALHHFTIYALDVVDVVVSKLARFHSDDRADIQAMISSGLVTHGALAARFEAAKDIRQDSSYAYDLPKYVPNLHRVERDYLGVQESTIELPPWVE